ncbi:MAG: hypothetical protein Q7S25_03310 [Candidatus Limnocylindria bacterium]|nr:hypothetical protein [Candidatus Limnocylindria bacterium]
MTVDRCTECGAPLAAGICGSCAPDGRPLDKGARRERALLTEHEKALWDQKLLPRKVHERPSPGKTPEKG